MRRSTYLAGNSVLSLITFKELVWFDVILPELFHDILANIRVVLLNLSSKLQLVFRGYSNHISSLTNKVQYELGNVTTGDGYMLDGTSDDIPFGTRNDMSYTITRVDDSSSECTVGDTVRRPRCCESEDSLDSDVKTFDVKGLEEDFGSLFTILGSIKWGFSL